METNRSKDLLNKVYDHLNTIDVTKLSMDELKDFLEVVQKGQFLESYGQGFQNAFGGYRMLNPNNFGTAQSATNGVAGCLIRQFF